MKIVQYSFPVTFTKEQIKNFTTVVIKTMLNYIKEENKKQIRIKESSLFIYPLNMSKIVKSRKILLVAKDKIGETHQEELDKRLVKEFEVANIKIMRNQFEK